MDELIIDGHDILELEWGSDVFELAGDATVFLSGDGGGDADTLGGQNSAYHLDRANHTGTQAQSTVVGLVSALAALVLTDMGLRTDIDAEVTARINAILNILFLLESKADLVGGFIPTSQIPAIAITEYLGIAESQSEMLALVGQSGDWCHRTDLQKAFIVIGEDTTDTAAWKEWPMPVSPVISINGQVGVVVLGKADIGLGNVPNIDATKRENHTGTQAAETITGLATVATSGNYNDLSNKPTIDTLNTVLHKTTTPIRERKNSGNVSPFDLNLRGMFETNYTFGANTLAVGDCYKIEYLIVVDLVTGQAGSLALTLIINGAVFNLTSELLVPLGVMTTSQHVEGVFNLSVTSIGATGRLITDGYAMHRNGAIAAYTQSFGSYNTTQPLTVNASVRFTSAPSGANTAYIKSARLIRVNNP